MEMEELTLEDIFEELDKIIAKPVIDRDAGEFTVNEYKQHDGCTHRSARYQLDKLVDAGILGKRRVFYGGKWVSAYKFL